MKDKDNTQQILLGDEAVGLAAVHAGISGIYGYPGTPSTEIFEFVEKEVGAGGLDIHAVWSTNEKVAFEEAMGMSYASKRAMVVMKHVGLNVAADPFMNAGVTGVTGGLVAVVADDPGMHSSQNEQDTRYFADFCQVPCFEPSNQQEAYDMTREAFELSERLKVPVVVRIVTRLAHSRANVAPAPAREQNSLAPSLGDKGWVLLPSFARIGYAKLLDKQPAMLEYTAECGYNFITGDKGGLGVICSGVGYNYFREAWKGSELPDYLKIGAYPMNPEMVRDFVDNHDAVVVVEDGYPFIEKKLNGLLGEADIRGKLTGHMPSSGEINPDLVAAAFERTVVTTAAQTGLPKRPPQLCKGCSHIDTYNALNEVIADLDEKTAVMGDIGCYTLGAYAPYDSIDSCVCMGASVGMARGAANAGMKYVAAVIGDSTFAHSGITPLLGAAREDTPMTVFILDNATVAMTGGQKTMATGTPLVDLVKGLGVPEEHIRVLDPRRKKHEENVSIIREEFLHRGLSVIIPTRRCIQIRD